MNLVKTVEEIFIKVMETFEDLLRLAVYGLAICAILYAIAVFGGQVYIWLKHGEWISLPAKGLFAGRYVQETIVPGQATDAELDAFLKRASLRDKFWTYIPHRNPREGDWFLEPTSWVGLQRLITRILEFMSVPVFCILVAWGLFGLGGRFSDNIKE